ncbi:bifunctional proline dehydrogenase/L-glutamate gamma-semialdehyde dehydrogenase [Microbacterium gorillae]|uniref:bifunctional proline dehydrogenase/L-glutamate gamma-semialdehyde dehydrogenase n=1 Tax=Microbacterium gorillae TaxID=1231063 RepID=UPI00058B475E|nr:bifunctional proline dehydrogenase/L-glutamate gamma-semialdehyde dehydrogenase [Microbacterium gorillae]
MSELVTADGITTADVVATVRRWLDEAAQHPVDPAAERLAGVLKDAHGLDFTVGFVDGVMRPEDTTVAASALRSLVPLTPKFLPAYLRGAIGLGGAMAPAFPWAVIPIARRVLRQMVGHLVLDATPAKLGAGIAKLRAGGHRLNLNLLGEAVLGEDEAERRLEGTRKFLARDDVDYVSIKVSAVVSQLSMWSFDEAVAKVVEKLTPLYELAARAEREGKAKFINLDMEEYRDLDLTIAVFTALLDQPQLRDLEAGIVLQTYLPDALGAIQHLQEWSAQRRANGGAPIKVRVVKGANLAMEHVDATVHGWEAATVPSKQEADTNYKRVLDWSMTPERTANLRLGIAGHNLFDVAHAWLLSKKRGVTDGVEFEMLLGMATGQAEAVRADVGELLLYTPVVNPSEFDVAIAYLIRRLEENASQENFMSAVFELDSDQGLFDREQARYEASLAEHERTLGTVPGPNRTQNRATETPDAPLHDFRNEPDTDPALGANRAWGREILARAADSDEGVQIITDANVADADALETVIAGAHAAGTAWGQRSGDERADILHAAGLSLARNRGRLIEVMASEAGKTIAEADVEVSEAIDFAHYYAELARGLDRVDGATFVPSKLTVVVPPWNFPTAIPAGGVLAALAAGSGVIIKPARLTKRTGAVMVDALWQGGVPRDVLRLVQLSTGELGSTLVADERVDRVILTGSYETAELFRSFRQDLPLLAETSGKNAIIVTPSADLDLAAADVTKSAFGHAGQKCSAASLVILVGSVAKSDRFRRQLVDSVTSLRVGYPTDPTTVMGPIVEPAQGKLLGGLTTLGAGEKWLIEPKQLDESGKLWSPGVRTGVKNGSEYHLTEYFGPILGIMEAATLEEALEMQNAVDYGLTAGLHSLDPDELKLWLEKVEAGNLYVNRGITGAIVRRQPFGGWKRSAVGAGSKAGGPNYLHGLGDWTPAEPTARPMTLSAPVERIVAAADGADAAWLRAAAGSDERAWQDEFGVARDVSNLGVERNVFRYRALPVAVRVGAEASEAEGLRVIAAGVRAGAPVSASFAVAPSRKAAAALTAAGVTVSVDKDAAWLKRLSKKGLPETRLRLVGGDASAVAAAVDGSPDVAVWSHAVTSAGRVEMLPFLREQAISITNHRFGNPTSLSDGLL